MRKLIVSEFLTLDGVMQAPGTPDEDTSGGFKHGGWITPYFDEISGKAAQDGIAAADAFLIGRKTYDIWADFWPSPPPEEAEFADVMNSKRKYVVSREHFEPEWENTTLIEGDVVAEIKKLKQQPGKNILVSGSGELAQTLMEHNLIDEYQLMIHPLVLGQGKRLFRDGSPKQELELTDTTTTKTGVVILTYKVKQSSKR